MVGFDNYKKKTFILKIKKVYNNLLNTRIKKIIFNSSVAFVFGICLGTFGIILTRNIQMKKAVGGFETLAVPQYKAEDFAELNKNDITEELAVTGPTGEDSLDMAASVLEAENINSENLELCYYPYRVKQGDVIGFIADSFNVTSDTIISVNGIKQSRLLQIGQYLKIPSMPGILYTVRTNNETIESIAEKYEVSAEKCARINSLPKEKKLAQGKTLFVPDAQLDWVTRQEINGDLFIKPLRSRYWLSSQFGWRSSPFTGKRSYHSGVDMAAPSGTSVYAALAGRVTTVSYNDVYGNYIIVTHHSGYKTLYAHLSATLVSVGTHVNTNTRIGRVGNTGLSTGPHLHFTVFKFGKTVNPVALWK